MQRSSLFLSSLLAMASWGCAVPLLEIAVHPADARVYVDGRRARAGVVRLPYYGTTVVSGQEAAGGESGITRSDDRSSVTTLEPYSPWLFPLDFLLEVATYPFNPDRYEHLVRVDLPVRSPVESGTRPGSVDPIRQRGKLALIER
jgi:hypothetical protein